MLIKRGMEEIGNGMRHTDRVRFRWTIKASEVNWKQFVEGKHMVNQLSNINLLTDKFHFQNLLSELNKQMSSGAIVSAFYQSTKEFVLETYRLSKNSHLSAFLANKSKDRWVVKNTSLDKD
jgi:hypothetical protein